MNISYDATYQQIYSLPQVQYHCVNTKIRTFTIHFMCEYIRIRLTGYG